ncbi:MAG: hypothetical protein DWQ07_24375 [Chloroflexi bacterium]|nr:MAG: hypothetical protein DWQ07_24375 [Chloroflexota bacterium]MBL1196270.1 hypothetical protein [Chloroflexota bacterium]NOH13565.1 hypothetical protein [Chloroflexota bacterium]
MRDYEIELEIFEGNGGQARSDGTRPDFAKEGICAWMYKSYQVGDKFRYPEDLGEMCPWLVDSLTGVIHALEHGGTLPWKYQGTPYEKVIDPDGLTTEFVRCLDPTESGIVIKVTRTALPE